MKCPEGQYYCFDDEKCKPIPKGKKVRKDGELVDAGNVGVAGTQYDEEKYYVREVAPPGYGHTKGDKEKGVKRGGTAAAFDRARKEGRFKGSKSDMFAIMWSQKNKGDKPHYKPGTNKKYKKYQDESFEIDKSAHKTAQKKAKLRNLAKGNTNPNEKAAAEKKAGGPKLMGEGKRWDSYKKAVATVLGKKKEEKKPQKATDAGARAKRLLQRKVHAKYVSGSEDLVPDEMRD